MDAERNGHICGGECMSYQITASAILAVFYGAYFLKMLQQRKRGIRTDQMGRGKAGLSKVIEILLKAITIVVPVCEMTNILLNLSVFPAAIRLLGAVVAAAGTALFIASVLTMRDSWRAGVASDEKTDLVTTGIYSISRNPAFLGFDLVYIGILLMFFSPVLLIVSWAAAILIHLQIVNVEEDHLLETHGDQYLRYRQEVHRYLGRSA